MHKLWVGVTRFAAILTLWALAGCGADGEPVQPTKNAIVGDITDSSVYAEGDTGSLFIGF